MGKIILKWILTKTGYEGMDWIHLAQVGTYDGAEYSGSVKGGQFLE
jgi:hypothetical protein